MIHVNDYLFPSLVALTGAVWKVLESWRGQLQAELSLDRQADEELKQLSQQSSSSNNESAGQQQQQKKQEDATQQLEETIERSCMLHAHLALLFRNMSLQEMTGQACINDSFLCSSIRLTVFLCVHALECLSNIGFHGIRHDLAQLWTWSACFPAMHVLIISVYLIS